MNRALFVSSFAVVAFLSASPAAAHRISGAVYCDANGDSQIDPGDTPLDGVQVKATSLVFSPGEVRTDLTGDLNPPAPPAQGPGTYKFNLPGRTDDYKVELTGVGQPLGSSVIAPAGGSHTITIVTGTSNPNDRLVDGVDFLLTNCVPECLENTDCNDENPCTDDSCVDTKCVYTPNTVPCDDGNECTVGDACKGGACSAGGAFTCPSDDNPCTDESCVPGQGCKSTPNTAPCDDGNECTVDDACKAGACSAGGAFTCPSDNNPCTDEICVPGQGCIEQNNDGSCSDGNPCTTGDTCIEGECTSGTAVECDDENPCNGPEVCDPETGACSPGPAPFPGGFKWLVRKFARIGDGSCIEANIGANDLAGQLRFGRTTLVPSPGEVSADFLKFGVGSNIAIAHYKTLLLATNATVNQQFPGLVLPLNDPYCPIPALKCGTTAIQSERNGGAVIMSPGDYGAVRMRNNSTLRFESPGTYNICSLRAGRNVHIEVSNAGPTTLNVVGDFVLRNGCEVASAGFPLVINVGGKSVNLGALCNVFADLSAPAARLHFGRSVSMRGSFCVDTAFSDNGLGLVCPEKPGACQ